MRAVQRAIKSLHRQAKFARVTHTFNSIYCKVVLLNHAGSKAGARLALLAQRGGALLAVTVLMIP